MTKGFVSGAVLLILGLVCGLLLATVNSFTAPIILAAENQAKYEAIGEFYDLSAFSIEEQTVSGSAVDSIYLLKNSSTGSLDAIVYSVSEYGYQSEIKMLIAINGDYTVAGYTVVSSAESKPIDHDWNMLGASINDIGQFDSIAGTTYSSDAIKGCFEAVFARVASDFGGGN